MNTRMKHLAATCSLIATGSACALDITSSANVPVVQVYLTGASALSNDVVNAVVNGPCAAGTADLYKDATGGSNFLYILCTAGTGLATAGSPIAVAFRLQGGSFYGTAPVGSTPVGHYTPAIVSGGADGCPGGGGPVTVGAKAVSGGATCTGWTASSQVVTSDIPDIGISDEEPIIFTQNTINQPIACTSQGDTSCPSPSTSNFSSAPALVEVEGIVASQPFIDALTAAGAGGFTNINGSPTVNLRHNWIVETFATGGSVVKGKNWSRLSGIVTGVTGSTNGFSGAVVLCRRAAGSGNQAALNAHFFNNACNEPGANQATVVTAQQSGLTGTAVPAAGATSGVYVIDNSSAGAVKTCVATASSNGYLALGVLSFDQSTSPGTTGQKGPYDFVAIDGDIISDATVTGGAYPYVFESTFQTSLSIASNKADIASSIFAQLSTVPTLSANGVYSLKGTTAGSSTKVMKFTTGGHACAPAQ